MAQGSLKLPLTDVRSQPVTGPVNVEFSPVRLAGNAGGASMQVGDTDLAGDTELIVSGIECLAGPGTLYRVAVGSVNYKTYSSFERIVEQQVTTSAANQIRLVVNPGRVRDIEAAAFESLPIILQQYLDHASLVVEKPEDREITGVSGAALYDTMGPLRKACLLNLFTKANHATAGQVFQFIEGQTLLIIRQDRLFTTIDPAVESFLRGSPQFKPAPKLLHTPLDGFQLHHSFKSRDDHANIQVTLMRKSATGEMAADVDIDESSGIEHGFETLSNLFRGRTNPFLIRELMILRDPEELTLDPGYGFIFR